MLTLVIDGRSSPQEFFNSIGTSQKKRFGQLMGRLADLHLICCSLLFDPEPAFDSQGVVEAFAPPQDRNMARTRTENAHSQAEQANLAQLKASSLLSTTVDPMF
jgi:hypothetical protein